MAVSGRKPATADAMGLSYVRVKPRFPSRGTARSSVCACDRSSSTAEGCLAMKILLLGAVISRNEARSAEYGRPAFEHTLPGKQRRKNFRRRAESLPEKDK